MKSVLPNNEYRVPFKDMCETDQLEIARRFVVGEPLEYVLAKYSKGESCFTKCPGGRLDKSTIYRIPRETVTITIPKPMTEAPKIGTKYYMLEASNTGYVHCRWDNHDDDLFLLENGRAYATEEEIKDVVKAFKEAAK